MGVSNELLIWGKNKFNAYVHINKRNKNTKTINPINRVRTCVVRHKGGFNASMTRTEWNLSHWWLPHDAWYGLDIMRNYRTAWSSSQACVSLRENRAFVSWCVDDNTWICPVSTQLVNVLLYPSLSKDRPAANLPNGYPAPIHTQVLNVQQEPVFLIHLTQSSKATRSANAFQTRCLWVRFQHKQQDHMTSVDSRCVGGKSYVKHKHIINVCASQRKLTTQADNSLASSFWSTDSNSNDLIMSGLL